MAVIEKLKGAVTGEPTKPPDDIQKRIRRGREKMQQGAALRNECLNFWRGNQYIYRSNDNFLVRQGTITNPDGSGKPPHRVRQVRNLILDVVAQEVSASTQRVPGYEISPTTTDPEDVSAGRL